MKPTLKDEIYAFLHNIKTPVTASWISHSMGIYFYQARENLKILINEGVVKKIHVGRNRIYYSCL